ncbi:MAG: hypothetical protein AAF288_09510 [Planctomycetota bacterium]
MPRERTRKSKTAPSERLLQRGAVRWAAVRAARWSGPAAAVVLTGCALAALGWAVSDRAWPWWLGLAAAVAVAAGVVGLAWWLRPGATRIAGWLDHELGLQDSLGTRLYLNQADGTGDRDLAEDPWARRSRWDADRRSAGRGVAAVAPLPWRGSAAWWSGGLLIYAGACIWAPDAAAWWRQSQAEAQAQADAQARNTQSPVLDAVEVAQARAELTAIAQDLAPDAADDLLALERELGEMFAPDGADPADLPDPAARLSSVHERLEEQAARNEQALASLERRLSAIDSGVSGPADDLERALRRGDLGAAARAYEALSQQLAGDSLDPADRARLQEQADRLADQLAQESAQAARDAQAADQALQDFLREQRESVAQNAQRGDAGNASDALSEASPDVAPDIPQPERGDSEDPPASEQSVREQAERRAQAQGADDDQARQAGESAAQEFRDLETQRQAAERASESLDQAGESVRELAERAGDPASDVQPESPGSETAERSGQEAGSEPRPQPGPREATPEASGIDSDQSSRDETSPGETSLDETRPGETGQGEPTPEGPRESSQSTGQNATPTAQPSDAAPPSSDQTGQTQEQRSGESGEPGEPASSGESAQREQGTPSGSPDSQQKGEPAAEPTAEPGSEPGHGEPSSEPGDQPGAGSPQGQPAPSGESGQSGAQPSGQEGGPGQSPSPQPGGGGEPSGGGEPGQGLQRLAEEIEQTRQQGRAVERLGEVVQRMNGGGSPTDAPSGGYGTGTTDLVPDAPRQPWEFDTDVERERRQGEGRQWSAPAALDEGRTNTSNRAWDQRVTEARDAAERAVADDRLPKRYHQTMREYFRRLPDTARGAAESAPPAGDTPEPSS